MYTPSVSPPQDRSRLSPPSSSPRSPRSPRPRGMVGIDPAVLRRLNDLQIPTEMGSKIPALVTEIPFTLSPSPSFPSSPLTPMTPEDSPFLPGMSRSGSGASIPIFFDEISRRTETFGLGIGDSEALKGAISKEGEEAVYQSTFRKSSCSTASSLSTLDPSRTPAGSYSSASTAATSITNAVVFPTISKDLRDSFQIQSVNQSPQPPSTPPRTSSLPRKTTPSKSTRVLRSPPAFFPVDYSLTQRTVTTPSSGSVNKFMPSPRSTWRPPHSAPTPSPIRSPNRSSFLSSHLSRRDSGYSRVVEANPDIRLLEGRQVQAVELVIDQEGFRELRARLTFFRQDGNVLEYTAAIKGVTYPFHSSPLQRRPALRRLHVVGDLEHDYLRKEMKLVIKNNGFYKAAALDNQGRLRYCFIYEVTDRLSLNAAVLPGEKLLRPILFLCSPDFLDPSRGRKIGILSILKKVVASPGKATLFRPASAGGI